MKLNVTYAKDPVWADQNQQTINLVVKFEEYPDEMSFTASPTDPEPHGVWLYTQAVEGVFGTIASYPGPVYTVENNPNTLLNPLQFLNRFTESEQLAIVTIAMTVPAIKLWYDRLMLSQFVSLTSENLSSKLDLLVSNGVITPTRKIQILTP